MTLRQAQGEGAPVVCDIWGGPGSQEWLARFVRPADEAIEIARAELARGYLVNLRAEIAWGSDQEFDLRGRPN